ncbi:MAG: tRNA-specific 2-thiouridylase [Candidatus Doudnabacteria bacterium]|nr:tRNA-specific 2-thiouridylase [Candidatus Doudnabacteria bacterium]
MKKPQAKKTKKVLIARNPLSRSLRSGSLPQKGESRKVLIALSGGIDSAVSAYLLIKQGYQVEAAFMKNWSSTAGLLKNECPWLADRQEALRVAAFLRIKLHTLDFEKQYQDTVMKYFFTEYKAGRTPNPDVMCNKEIKFKLLYNWAMKNGFDYLATGHYAQTRIKNQELPARHLLEHQATAGGRIKGNKASTLNPQPSALLRSKDEFKDQTYFIYNIKSEQLPHILFPIGGMKKTAVKKLADKLHLPNAGRKESMGLCFVGKIRLNEFLGQKLKPKMGKIVDQDGQILGHHEGLQQFTIGQRQGIKVGANGPYFVFKKDLKANTLYVTNNPADERLFVKEIQLHSLNWISPHYNLESKIPAYRTGRYNLTGRYRHQGELVPLTISKIKKDLYRVVFNKPQKAVASGQSLVLYKGKECVGGGVIV